MTSSHAAALSPAEFDEERSREILERACGRVGINAGHHAELLRLGEHAVFRLPHQLVARVGRGPSHIETAQREVDVSRWWSAAGIPVVEAHSIEQPVIVSGHPVTWWAEIPGPLQRGHESAMGSILAQLHEVAPSSEVALPQLQPFDRVTARIESAPLTDRSKATLRALHQELAEQWHTATFDLPPGVLHGDAHCANLALGSDGRHVLIDLETACLGPREWDLAVTASYVRFGWLTRGKYEEFAEAYGYDVTQSSCFEFLRRVRELRMTSWLAQRASEPAVAEQVEHRIASMLDPTLPRKWGQF